MTKRKRTLIIVAAIGLALFVALQVFLSFWLTGAVQNMAPPIVRKQFGIDLSIRRTSFNLLTGTVSLSGVRAGNPAGFPGPDMVTLERGSVNLSLWGFLRRVTRIEDARLSGLDVTVIRNAAGDINLGKVADASSPASAGGGAPATPSPPSLTAAEKAAVSPAAAVSPRVRIENMNVMGRINYLDQKAGDPPAAVGYDVRLKVRGLATYGNAKMPWGTLDLRGHLASDTNSMVTRITGRVAPLTDPDRPSFDAAGEIESIDVRTITALAGKQDFECDPFAIKLNLVCRDGKFDDRKSLITVCMKDVKLHGKLAKSGIKKVSSLTVPIPLGGTLKEPKILWDQAIMAAVMHSLGSGLDSLLKGSGGETNKAGGLSGMLGDLLRGKPKK